MVTRCSHIRDSPIYSSAQLKNIFDFWPRKLVWKHATETENRRYFCQRQKDGCVRKVNTFRENGNAPCWDTEIVGKMASSPEGIENFLSVNFQNFYESTSSRSSSVYSSWKLVFQNNQNWKLGSSYSKSRKMQFSQSILKLDIWNQKFIL